MKAWYILGYDIPFRFGTYLFSKGDFMLESGELASYEQEKTSNFRESENLIFCLEQGVVEGRLHQEEVFVLT